MNKTLSVIVLVVLVAALLGACTSAPAATPTVAPGGGDTPAPPTGTPPGTQSGTGAGGSGTGTGLSSASGVYTVDGTTETQTDQSYTATGEDQSGIYVINGGDLTLENVQVNTSGNTSSQDNSSFYGLNAGILATSGSMVTMNGGAISTIGTGANGAFATGSGTLVKLANVDIQATGDGGHGVMATLAGTVDLSGVNIVTSGAHGAPIAADRGGGTITAAGGAVSASGQDSPCYYSTGTLSIANGFCNASGSEAVVIEGSNAVVLTETALTSTVASKWGVLIYRSASGDAQGGDGVFTMTDGRLQTTDATSPLFYVSNATGHITLQNVRLAVASGILVQAEGNDRWGTPGANGGTLDLVADSQILQGDFVADDISSLGLTLQNATTFSGAIDAANTALSATLTLDASSVWNVTADSYLDCLTDPDGISGETVTNITGSYTIYYDPGLCIDMGSRTYLLDGGGTVQPID